MSIYPSQYAQIPEGDLMSWNTDRDVEPVVMTRGIMYKTGGVWYFWDGQSRSADAGLMRVSALGVTVTTSPLSADGSSVSAIQADASKLRISAYADDAAKFRVSAVNFVAGVSANQSISALNLEGSAFIGQVSAILKDNPVNATYLGRVSTVGSVAISASQSLSALALEGTAHIGQVSAVLVDDATANKFLGRVSALGVTVTTSPLSADGSSVSALQGDAAKLRISAFNLDAGLFKISAESDDAGQFRVSTIGTQTVSAHEVKQSDASSLRVSGVIDSGSVSAKSALAAQFYTSAFSYDGASFRVSVVTGSLISCTNKEGTAFIGSVSNAGGVVSATMKEGTAFIGQVSTILKDNPTNATYLGHVSCYSAAANQVVSAACLDAGTFHISAYSSAANQAVSAAQSDAVNLNVSCKSGDATSLRVSADLYCDTTGSLTAFQTLSISASQNIKSTAAALYGYYLFNTDTKPNYVRIYNSSGAVTISDTPIISICLPASAAANMEFAHGIKGFTAGMTIACTSGRPADNTAAPAASAVGGTFFYA